MLFKILKRTFWSWWDNLSYSILTSLMAGTNPFYLVLLASFTWMFVDFTVFIDYSDLFFVLGTVLLLTMNVFPTTLASYSTQSKIIDGDFMKYFRTWWQELKRLFGRGIVVSLINTVIGVLLGYSIVFYNTRLAAPFNYILISLTGLLFLLFLLSQLIMPVLLFTDKYKWYEYYLISFHMTVKNGFVLFWVGIFNALFLLLFLIPGITPVLTVIPLTAYFGLASTLHIWAFRYIDGQVSVNDPMPERKARELLSPFAGLFKRKKKKDKEKNDNK